MNLDHGDFIAQNISHSDKIGGAEKKRPENIWIFGRSYKEDDMARQGPAVVFERRYECTLEGDFLAWVEEKQKASGIKSRSEFLKRQLAAQDFESWTQLSQRMAEVGQAINALRAQLDVHPCPHCHASIEAASDEVIRTMRAVYRAIPKRKVDR